MSDGIALHVKGMRVRLGYGRKGEGNNSIIQCFQDFKKHPLQETMTMTYRETIRKYKAGLISKKEANEQIALINMGSDSHFYYPVN